MKECHFITVASDPTEGLHRLFHSYQRNGITPHILGYGKEYRGHGCKQLRAYDYLQAYTKDDDIVIAADAYDVVLLSTKDEIIEKFLSFNTPIVYTAENFCWPDAELREAFPPSSTPYRYLNAGLCIGYASALKEITEQIFFEESWTDDQFFVQHYYLKHQDNIQLDTKCVLFQSLFDYPDTMYKIENQRFINLLTGTSPCLLHGNGFSGLEFLSRVESSLFDRSFGPYNAIVEDSATLKKIEEAVVDCPRQRDALYPSWLRNDVLRWIYAAWKRKGYRYHHYLLAIKKIPKRYNAIHIKNTIGNVVGKTLSRIIEYLPLLREPLFKTLEMLKKIPHIQKYVPGILARIQKEKGMT